MVVVRVVSGRIRSYELCANVTIIVIAMLIFSTLSYSYCQFLINFQIVTMRCVWSSKNVRGSIPNRGYSMFDSGIRKSDFTRNVLFIIHNLFSHMYVVKVKPSTVLWPIFVCVIFSWAFITMTSDLRNFSTKTPQ